MIKVKTKSGFSYLELDALKFYNWSKSKLSKNIYYFLTKKAKQIFKKMSFDKNWEKLVYKKSLQINQYPFDWIVSSTFHQIKRFNTKKS